MKRLFWIGMLVCGFVSLFNLFGHTNWPLEIGVLLLTVVFGGFSYFWEEITGQRGQGRCPSQASPVNWHFELPDLGILTILVVGIVGLMCLGAYASGKNPAWLQAAFLCGVLVTTLGVAYKWGWGIFGENLRLVAFILSIVYLAWTALGNGRGSDYVLPIFLFIVTFLFLIKKEKEVAEAIGDGIVWIFRQAGKVLTGVYGAFAAAVGYWVLCIGGVFLFAGSHPDLAYLFGIGGGIATFIIFFLPGKKMADRAKAH